MAQPLTIGRLAKAAGVHVETVRYYQRRGLIKEPSRPAGSHRHYSPSVVERLDFIRRAQQLGFSLDEIKQLLKVADGVERTRAIAIIDARRAALRDRMRQIAAMLRRLDRVVRKISAAPGRKGTSIVDLVREEAAR